MIFVGTLAVLVSVALIGARMKIGGSLSADRAVQKKLPLGSRLWKMVVRYVTLTKWRYTEKKIKWEDRDE